MKDEDVQLLMEIIIVRKRWAAYFKQLLNVDVRKSSITTLNGRRISVLGELHESS